MATRETLDRAVVLDFEGFVEAPPALACELVDGREELVVFDEALIAAARRDGLRVLRLERYLRDLVARLRREDRKLLAFSSREAQVVREVLGMDLVAEGRYLDGRPLLRHWRSKRHPEVARKVRARRARLRARGKRVGTEGNRLIDYAALAGIAVPRSHAHGHSTSRLRHVRDQLASRGAFENLTPTAKGKWTKLLNHVRFDCTGLLAACRMAVGAE
jgi:hypothetical protein